MATPRVRVQTEDFDLGAEVAALRAGDPGVGAVAAFIGTVRDRNDGLGVSSMELEHYPGMTEKAIDAMIDVAMQRFDIRAARVIHRVGLLQPQDQIVMVAVSSANSSIRGMQRFAISRRSSVCGWTTCSGRNRTVRRSASISMVRLIPIAMPFVI